MSATCLDGKQIEAWISSLMLVGLELCCTTFVSSCLVSRPLELAVLIWLLMPSGNAAGECRPQDSICISCPAALTHFAIGIFPGQIAPCCLMAHVEGQLMAWTVRQHCSPPPTFQHSLQQRVIKCVLLLLSCQDGAKTKPHIPFLAPLACTHPPGLFSCGEVNSELDSLVWQRSTTSRKRCAMMPDLAQDQCCGFSGVLGKQQ